MITALILTIFFFLNYFGLTSGCLTIQWACPRSTWNFDWGGVVCAPFCAFLIDCLLAGANQMAHRIFHV